MTGIPWKLIGIVAAAALLTWAGVWVTHRIQVSYQAELERDAALADLTTEREQNAANIGKIAGRITFTEALGKDLSAKLAGIDDRFNHLRFELPLPENLIQSKEKPGDPCPAVSIGPEYFRVFNAAATEGAVTESETR